MCINYTLIPLRTKGNPQRGCFFCLAAEPMNEDEMAISLKTALTIEAV
jgi:hypothetical protein